MSAGKFGGELMVLDPAGGGGSHAAFEDRSVLAGAPAFTAEQRHELRQRRDPDECVDDPA